MRAIKTTTISILAVGLLAGSAVAVAAQDKSSGQFTGTMDASAATDIDGTYEAGLPDVLRGFGMRGAIAETDDERISGTISRVANFDWHTPAEPQLVHAGTSLWLIENDGGTWNGHGTDFSYTTDWSIWDENDPSTWSPVSEHVVLTGEGDYEGLTAMMTVEPTDVGILSLWGVVFPGELPPFPEMIPAAESAATE